MMANTSGGRLGGRRAGAGLVPPAAADPAATRSAYMVTKVLTAMVLGAVVGGDRLRRRRGQRAVAACPAGSWVVSGLVAWLGALVFAAFGLFIGYLVPSENVMQLLGPALALLALMGGIFVPLDVLQPTRCRRSRRSPRPTAWACWPGPR